MEQYSSLLSGVSKSRRACSRSVRRPPAVRLHFIELDFVLIESELGTRNGWLADWCFGGFRKTQRNGKIFSVVWPCQQSLTSHHVFAGKIAQVVTTLPFVYDL